MKKGSWVSQFDKDDVEAVGLVKFDFLGPAHTDHH
jgi:DNA polymerase-3 subunit alpha